MLSTELWVHVLHFASWDEICRLLCDEGGVSSAVIQALCGGGGAQDIECTARCLRRALAMFPRPKCLLVSADTPVAIHLPPSLHHLVVDASARAAHAGVAALDAACLWPCVRALRSVHLRHARVHDIQFAWTLGRTARLYMFSSIHSGLGDIVARALARLDTLESAMLSGEGLTDAAASAFAASSFLEELLLPCNRITASGAAHLLAGTPALRALDLSGNLLGEGALPAHPRLERLVLAGCGLREVPDAVAHAGAALRHVNLSCNPGMALDAAAVLPALPAALREVHLARVGNLDDAALNALLAGGNMPALHTLNLYGNRGVTAVPGTADSMPALRVLDLGATGVASALQVVQHKRLHTLSLYGTLALCIRDAVTQLPALRELDLRQCLIPLAILHDIAKICHPCMCVRVK